MPLYTKKHLETLTIKVPETDLTASTQSVRQVGGSALIHFEGTSPVIPPEIATPSESFEYLFPATRIPAELLLTEASTAESAERLLNKLEDGDPHKDYAISHLALHHMNQGNLSHAYEMLHQITDEGTATYVLSQLIMYEDDHHITVLPLDRLGQELHELAIHAYNKQPIAKNARAIREASEALPDDDELRLYAQVAAAEHPEIRLIVD